MTDPIAANDQLCKESQLLARVQAAHFNELVKEGVPPDEASWFTGRYTDHLLEDRLDNA